MVGKFGWRPVQLRVPRKFSESGFTKLFLCMKKLKKAMLGLQQFIGNEMG
jgi:hypothetical protein